LLSDDGGRGQQQRRSRRHAEGVDRHRVHWREPTHEQGALSEAQHAANGREQ
jgi:hypothetical protein